MVLAPLGLHALWTWRRAEGDEKRARGRLLVGLAAIAVGAVIIGAAIPSVRDGALRLLRDPVPGLRFGPGLHVDTLAVPFRVVSWWAWIPLAPLAILGLRRTGRWAGLVCLHLLVPTLLVAVLFESTRVAGIGSRYLLHLVPLVAVVVGLACAAGMQLITDRWRALARPLPAITALAATLVVAAVFGVWRLPGEAHPTRIIPRPNWNAAGAFIGARSQPGDGLLSTGPLAMFWSGGRCGDWLRARAAAEPYMLGDRDVYCASRLVPDTTALATYVANHRSGWVVADPRQWPRSVDPAVRQMIERTFTRVDAGDPSILVYRWGR
jgi:hypothetical protein